MVLVGECFIYCCIMTLKATGNELSFSEIEAEFGQNGSRSLGGYRLTQNIGTIIKYTFRCWDTNLWTD